MADSAATVDVEPPDDDAAALARPRGYLRDRDDEDSARVSFIELFFDLVFVFGVTQLSAFVVDSFSPEGFVRAGVLFVAIWWLWINTAWATNRLDPDRSLVRIVIFALTVVGLVFSTALPMAFEERALVFAVAYAAMQVGRSLFLVWALRQHGEEDSARTFGRVALWFAATGGLWIGGALAEADLRLGLWAAALLVELAVPWTGFWVPGLGRSSAREWDIEGEHLTERCGLFVIIALGESLLVTGQRMSGAAWDAATWAAFGTALAGTLTMWWVYFDTGAKRGTRAFEQSPEPGRLARFAYTYVHQLIGAGIVLTAVGDKFLLDHPSDPPDWPSVLGVLGGPALFLLGNFLFKNATSRRWPLSHVAGLAALAAGLLIAGWTTTLGIAAYAVAVLAGVAMLERVLLRSRAAAEQGLK